MPLRVYLVALSLVVIFAGCKSTDTSVPANSSAPVAASPANVASPATSTSSTSTDRVKAKVDVCNLLTSDDLKQVQGEPFKEAQRSDRQEGEFIVAQCYYSLPTTVNSVVLNVTTANEGAGARSPRAFWEDTFGREEEKNRAREGKGKAGSEREKEKEGSQKDKPREGGEEREESAPPEKVQGLGDEAFWIASRVGGALYVLKKDLFFRISVGGAGDAKTKLNKSKTLAQRVLKRI